MPYSFIEPVSKSPFSPTVRKVWYGGLALIAVVLSVSAFLHFKSGEQRKAAMQEETTQESLKVQVEQLVQQQTQFESEKSLRQQTYTANQLVVDRVSDLLDLIPDDTTLERFDINGSSVTFEGNCLRFEALQTSLVRALSGQFVLAESRHTPSKELTHFVLRFATNGETR